MGKEVFVAPWLFFYLCMRYHGRLCFQNTNPKITFNGFFQEQFFLQYVAWLITFLSILFWFCNYSAIFNRFPEHFLSSFCCISSVLFVLFVCIVRWYNCLVNAIYNYDSINRGAAPIVYICITFKLRKKELHTPVTSS